MAQELKDEAERLQREALDESETLKVSHEISVPLSSVLKFFRQRELSAQKAMTTNEISRVVTERDAALERLKCGQTEKELLQVQISDLAVSDGSSTAYHSFDALGRPILPKKRRLESWLKS